MVSYTETVFSWVGPVTGAPTSAGALVGALGEAYVKIGKTTRMRVRATELRSYVPGEVTILALAWSHVLSERQAHTRLKTQRIAREWFADSSLVSRSKNSRTFTYDCLDIRFSRIYCIS